MKMKKLLLLPALLLTLSVGNVACSYHNDDNPNEYPDPQPEPEPEPEPEEEKSGGMGALALVLVLLMLGGGIGNLIDRVLNGEVVDYINVLFMRFAVFNFADICVCVGVALWVLVIFLEELHEDSAKEQ